MIAVRYIIDPNRAWAETGIVLSSPLARAAARVQTGAFPLGIALFSLWSLFSTERLKVGVSFVVITNAAVLAVRAFAVLTDGVTTDSVRLAIPKVTLMLLAMSGLLLMKAYAQNQSAS